MVAVDIEATWQIFESFRQRGVGDCTAGQLTVAHVMAAKEPPARIDPAGMLTVPECARKLGVSACTVRGLAASGKLPVSRIGNGRGTLRFDPADVEQFKSDTTDNPFGKRTRRHRLLGCR